MPKAILFIDHVDGIGGAEESLLLLIKKLDRTQWTPYLICPEGKLASLARQNGAIVFIFDLPKLRKSVWAFVSLGKVAHQIRTIARKINAAIVHSNSIRASIYTALASLGEDYAFVWHMRDFWLSEDKPKNPVIDSILKRILYRLARCVITNSYAVSKNLPYKHKTYTIHNGIDLSKLVINDLTELRAKFRQTYHIAPNDIVIGTVGRLRPWKGQHRFIEVAGLIRSTYPQAKYIIVGGDPFSDNGDYAKSLQEQITSYGLNNNFICTGQLNDPRSAFAAMDIFVHPGDPEPFGLVNIEAMATQKPVVAFAHGALPEIVIDGMTGVLVTPYNLPEMATQIEKLIQDLELRQLLGKMARHHVISQFSIEKTVSEI